MPVSNSNQLDRGGGPSRSWVWVVFGLLGGTTLTAIGILLFATFWTDDDADLNDAGIAENDSIQPALAGNPSIVPDLGTSGSIYESSTPSVGSVASPSRANASNIVPASIDVDLAKRSAEALFNAGRAAIKRDEHSSGWDMARYAKRILAASGVEKDRELIETFEHAGYRFDVYIYLGPDDPRQPKEGVYKLLTCEITKIGETKPSSTFEHEVEYKNGKSTIGQLYETRAGGDRVRRVHITMQGNRYRYGGTRASIIQSFDSSLRN